MSPPVHLVHGGYYLLLLNFLCCWLPLLADTANFTLRCGICQLGLKGEKEAVEHAKQTGHTSFREY